MTSQIYNRDQAETEAKEDMNKSIEQLLTDIHEETHKVDIGRGALENNLIAQKRIASMMAKVAQTNNDVSNRMLILTVISAFFCFIQILIACFK